MTPKDYVFPPSEIPALRIAGSEQLFPVHRIYCVGRNYAAHAREMGHGDREPPFFFCKPSGAATQSSTVSYPPLTSELHHEVELVVAIGKRGSNIDVDRAPEHIFGYAVGVDLTRRDIQAIAKQMRRPWDAAKGFDESAPLSAIVRASESEISPDAQISLSVDGEIRQSARLSDMLWSVAEVIAELSRFFTLVPGDLVFTGTPSGVGELDPGVKVLCEIQGLISHSFIINKIEL